MTTFTKGTLKNKASGEEYKVRGFANSLDITARFSDDDDDHYFGFKKWEFVPDRVTSAEQIRAFPLGTKFRIVDQGIFTYVKYSSRDLAYFSPTGNSSGTTKIANWFGDDDTKLEVIDD